MSEFKPVVSRYRPHSLWIVVVLLLIIAASRILQISLEHRDVHVDEVWSIWQLLGPRTDYLRDTTWPPLYYALLDGWRHLTGIDLVGLRFLSILCFLPAAATTYRLMRRLAGEAAGIIGMLGYSALTLGINFTTQVRGYGLVFSLLPPALWFTLRYFDRPTLDRQTILRALPVALVMAGMFWTAYGSIGAFLMLGLFTLLAYPRRIWRWAIVGVIAGVIALPAIIKIYGLATSRVDLLKAQNLAPMLEGLAAFYQGGVGSSAAAWLALLIVATVLIAWRQRPIRGKAVGLLLWGLGAVVLYVLNSYMGMFSSQYGWFVLLGAVLWIAWGLSYLPRPGQIITGAILIAIMITPLPKIAPNDTPPPLGRSFAFLRDHMQWGDVLTIDPLWKDRFCGCMMTEVFNYMTQLYFPQGLQVVANPQGYRRVWYLKWASLEDKAFEKTVETGRIASTFVGPPEALFRLYEAPPDLTGIVFENGLRFHGLQVVNPAGPFLTTRVGDTVRVRLWWTVDRPLTADYSISLQVFKDNALVIQSDSGPQVIDSALPDATSQWQPGQYYIEERLFDIPKALLTGDYPIYLTVYQWWDQKRLDAPGVNSDKLLPIYTIHTRAW